METRLANSHVASRNPPAQRSPRHDTGGEGPSMKRREDAPRSRHAKPRVHFDRSKETYCFRPRVSSAWPTELFDVAELVDMNCIFSEAAVSRVSVDGWS